MKRVMYISSLNADLSDEQIEQIGKAASDNNQKIGVTGVLMSAHEYFFQILEGEGERVDRLVERIRKDPRHRNLLILKAEDGIAERLFPDWSMKTVRLGGESDMLLQAIRIMLENITQSHRIIERYTQPSVLRFLTQGVNPLDIPVTKQDRIILFGDMLGFSYLSQRFPVEEVAEVVNVYLDVCSRHVSENGGEVAKYVGDCVMASFSSDQSDGAIQACLEALREVRSLRHGAKQCRLMKFLYCGFGLSRGEVIVGNFGSSIKLDYTLLGDPVNLAARLESLTREIQRAIAMSEAVRDSARTGWPFDGVGDYRLKGQERACPVYTIDDPVVAEFPGHDELVRNMETVCVV